MRHIKNIFTGGKDANRLELAIHYVYLTVFLLAFAIVNGFLALRLTAVSCAALSADELYASYFSHPPLVPLNLLPPVLFIALGYFLTRRAWAAYLISAVPSVGFALVNYYKIQLRGDPFLASDFRLIRTAGGILGHYTLDFTDEVRTAAIYVGAMFLFSLLFLPAGRKQEGRARPLGLLICVTLLPLLYFGVYQNDELYKKAKNDELINRWADVELFVSRGFVYSFIRSVPEAFPQAPPGYLPREAEAFLAQYPDADISPETQVNVVGVMLEAFSDLSDFPMLAELDAVQEIYTPLHELEAQCVSGDLLTNIFAGGTVDSEWGFLTGYAHHGEFRNDVDTYVRYFKSQGYDAVYRHPGYSWIYNRQNINRYLGFDGSIFTENGFGNLVDPEIAPYRSDEQLFDFLYRELRARDASDPPLFSFSVSYQNHGPYSSDLFDIAPIPAGTSGWSAESCGILSNYLYGVSDTVVQMVRFTEKLESLDKPVVLVMFGDHKPWLGNDNSVYHELAVNLDRDTLDGFYNFYSTPYLIWANSAAKEALGSSFTGNGGDFSPCFLMSELFDQCGWDGPAYMALQREVRAITPLIHTQGLFLENGELTALLSPEANELYPQYRRAEFWREHNGLTS